METSSDFDVKGWAESLVGRDWEIYWNDDVDNDTKEVPPTGTKDAVVTEETETSSQQQEAMKEDSDEIKQQNDDDSDSEGSIIDDWYAGRVLSVTNGDNGSHVFRVLFVGDEEVYEMELSPNKVRASARGWIKRTISLLCTPTAADAEDTRPWYERLPPDTAMQNDQAAMEEMRQQIYSKKYPTLHFPDMIKEGDGAVRVPTSADLEEILRLRHLLKSQVYLRSKLAPIENLHGSVKIVDGEINPTEGLVKHLQECCRDLDRACEWYLRCWDLLSRYSSDEKIAATNPEERDLDFDVLVDEYMGYGKACLLNCAAIDVESTNSKRRAPSTMQPTTGNRRAKRRRKQVIKWGATDHALEYMAETGDLRSAGVVDDFICKFQENPKSWSFALLGGMLQTVSHTIVDPLFKWQTRARQLLGMQDTFDDSPEEDTEEASASGSDGEDDDMSTDDSSQSHTYTLEEMEECLAGPEKSKVLSLFGTSEEKEALQNKVKEVQNTAVQVLDILARLPDVDNGPGDSKEQPSDPLLQELRKISKSIQSPESPLSNIDPIGKGDKAFPKSILTEAISLRTWLVDVRHASATRERKFFLTKLVERSDALPNPVNLASLVDIQKLTSACNDAKERVKEFQRQLSIIEPMERKYGEQIQDWIDKKPTNLQKIALELSKCSIILEEEEKVSLLIDLKACMEDAGRLFGNDESKLDYDDLEKLFQVLDQVFKGQSKTRSSLCENLRSIEAVESIMKHFVDAVVRATNDDNIKQVMSVYRASSTWKDKTEAVISALEMHRDVTIQVTGAKLPAMVDIKRISDLLSEYEGMGVDLTTHNKKLQNFYDESLEWSNRLGTSLSVQSSTFEQHLDTVEREMNDRPKGVIMDPTRQITDSMHDVLRWYKNVKSSFSKISAQMQEKSLTPMEMSENLVTSIFPLLAEGIFVVRTFAMENGSSFDFIPDQIIENLEMLGIRRSARALVDEKTASHPLVSTILRKMTDVQVDVREGSPLSMLVWSAWILSIRIFAETAEKSRSSSLSNDISLKQAQKLVDSKPSLHPSSPEPALLQAAFAELKTIDKLILEANELENEIREMLSQYRDLRKGSLEKADEIRSHLTRLRELQIIVRDRADGSKGLSLDSSLDSLLDPQIKVLTWLTKTFPYEFLYLDEASYQESEEIDRIPWSLLMSLHERMPTDAEESAGDFALVTLRVRELYEAAKHWEDEITRNTLLSNRGGKRRSPSSSQKTAETDEGSSAKLRLEKMKELVEHPILAKVAMPREDAVIGILQSSTEFEAKLHIFLGKDFEGQCPDRAAFPEKGSLVGSQGEFILFRLTGSELYASMLESVHSLGLIAENVLAETPGKSTFDWITRAVAWIEELHDAVTMDTPFQNSTKRLLIITASDARTLLADGEKIFLDVPEDLKKTLSQHRIFISTNKQEKSLRVHVKKGGAHHSIGGTVIRWCPLLFSCLRADVNRLEEWERELTILLGRFNRFFAKTRNNPKSSEDDLYRWYCYRQKVETLLSEGSQNLVVAPQQGLVSSFTNLLSSQQNYLAKHSTIELNRKFSKRMFAEGSSLLRDRFEFVEGLAFRRSLSAEKTPTELSSPEGNGFRGACRTYLFTSFSRAVKVIGLSKMQDLFLARDIESLCSLKAWEIENVMFDKFQESLGTSKVSEEYRSKARNFKASLDNPDNLSLCLRILTGDVSATDLVKMSRDQLASRKEVEDRARAAKEARNSAMLTKSPTRVPKDKTKQSPSGGDVMLEKRDSSSPVSILRGSRSAVSQENGNEVNVHTSESQSADASASASAKSEPVSSAEVLKKLASKTIATKSTAARPPPPPSLVSSFQQTHDDEDGPLNGVKIRNDGGGDRFRIEIVNLRLSFDSALYYEGEKTFDEVLNQVLPGSLMEKGRLPDKEFSRFVSEKLGGGRWIALALRMDDVTETRTFRKFCQAYEQKRRIPMFAINANTKGFLVVPKFHGATQAAGLPPLQDHTSPYMIVLTKDARIVRQWNA